MESLFVAFVSALWLGILTSISPCPLATNIAAISFIGRRVAKPSHVLMTGLLYTAGRMLTYVVIGILVVGGLLSIPGLSQFLQKYMNQLLGPLLILAGMFLLNLLSFSPGEGQSDRKTLQSKVEKAGIWGGALLGMVFALSFCPVSAALFFGSLVPLSIKYESAILLPSLYGIGTGLPVFISAVAIALGTRWVGAAFQQMTRFDLWARRITGILFLVIGVYFSLHFIFKLL